jgi:hypothetical protein
MSASLLAMEAVPLYEIIKNDRSDPRLTRLAQLAQVLARNHAPLGECDSSGRALTDLQLEMDYVARYGDAIGKYPFGRTRGTPIYQYYVCLLTASECAEALESVKREGGDLGALKGSVGNESIWAVEERDEETLREIMERDQVRDQETVARTRATEEKRKEQEARVRRQREEDAQKRAVEQARRDEATRMRAAEEEKRLEALRVQRGREEETRKRTEQTRLAAAIRRAQIASKSDDIPTLLQALRELAQEIPDFNAMSAKFSNPNDFEPNAFRNFLQRVLYNPGEAFALELPMKLSEKERILMSTKERNRVQQLIASIDNATDVDIIRVIQMAHDLYDKGETPTNWEPYYSKIVAPYYGIYGAVITKAEMTFVRNAFQAILDGNLDAFNSSVKSIYKARKNPIIPPAPPGLRVDAREAVIRPRARDVIPFAGTEVTGTDFQFKDNSCPFDSLLTALFKVPGLMLQQRIWDAKKAFTFDDTKTNVLAQQFHEALARDIEYLQQPDGAAKSVNRTREAWRRVLPLDMNMQDPRDLLDNLMRFYGLGYIQSIRGKLMEMGGEDDNIDLIMIRHDPERVDGRISLGTIAHNPPLQKVVNGTTYELVSCLSYQGGVHWVSYVRSIVDKRWFAFDAYSTSRHGAAAFAAVQREVSSVSHTEIPERVSQGVPNKESPCAYIYMQVPPPVNLRAQAEAEAQRRAREEEEAARIRLEAVANQKAMNAQKQAQEADRLQAQKQEQLRLQAQRRAREEVERKAREEEDAKEREQEEAAKRARKEREAEAERIRLEDVAAQKAMEAQRKAREDDTAQEIAQAKAARARRDEEEQAEEEADKRAREERAAKKAEAERIRLEDVAKQTAMEAQRRKAQEEEAAREFLFRKQREEAYANAEKERKAKELAEAKAQQERSETQETMEKLSPDLKRKTSAPGVAETEISELQNKIREAEANVEEVKKIIQTGLEGAALTRAKTSLDNLERELRSVPRAKARYDRKVRILKLTESALENIEHDARYSSPAGFNYAAIEADLLPPIADAYNRNAHIIARSPRLLEALTPLTTNGGRLDFPAPEDVAGQIRYFHWLSVAADVLDSIDRGEEVDELQRTRCMLERPIGFF